VAFSVARSQKLGPVLDDTLVGFDVVITNIGEGFDVTASRFVCRTNGTYAFTAHLLGQDNTDVYAWIMMNDKHKVYIRLQYIEKLSFHSRRPIYAIRLTIFGPHRTHSVHNARPIATVDHVAWYSSQSVCLSVTRLRCAKTAERIKVLFGMDILADPRHTVHVLDLVQIP